MSWLLTGGTGQLGTALLRELNNRESDVFSPKSSDLDITNQSEVHNFITSLGPTVIVNCAAWTDVEGAETNEDSAFKINAEGAENLALAARDCDAKFVQISTDYVFSGDTNTPWKISDLPDPKSAYGRTKAAGEDKVLKSYSKNTFLLRTSWLYSPWGKNFVKAIARQVFLGKELSVVDDQFGQPTSAVDLAHQIVNLVLSDSLPGIYHATNSGKASRFEFALSIVNLMGKEGLTVMPIKSSEHASNVNRPGFSVLDDNCWSSTKLTPMRNWEVALSELMPEIISELEL
jgi:dTDP-4-dehydrorhamnose reductase